MKIAIIGTGISALSTAYHLDRKIEIDMYDSNDRMGGHTHTHNIKIKNKDINVDTGFIVFNDRNYKDLLKAFKEFKLKINKSDMSYSFSNNETSWSSKNFFKLKYYFTLSNLIFFLNILKFNKCARNKKNTNKSIIEWIKENNFSKQFSDQYIFPMASAIWSTLNNKITEFPASTLLNFFENHGLTKIINRPQWLTLDNGSKSYIQKFKLNTNIKNIYLSENIKIEKKQNKIKLISSKFTVEYDYVVFTCNINQIKTILLNRDKEEDFIMNNFQYSENDVILHQDEQLMPLKRENWSSWNSFDFENRKYLTYWMNSLQNLDTKENLFVTVGDISDLKIKNVLKRINYEHIIFSRNTLKGQIEIEKIQGKNNIFYAGAYLGYGFHEDGFESGARVGSKINNILND
jgi:predicted NAD/FAD-binding protein